jgi:membrane protease YdiL (CAAX protease family)
MSMPENELILGLISVTTGVVLYVFGPSVWKSKYFRSNSNLDIEIWHIYSTRLSGLLWLGIIPGMLMGVFGTQLHNYYGLLYRGTSNICIPIIVLALLIPVLTFFNSQRKNNLKTYPQIRKKVWSSGLLAGSAVTWMLYLLGYEYLFRGILLFSSLETLDQYSAITLNVAMYSLFHLKKGLTEVLASIPFGIILCLLVIKSDSIWPAFFLHLELALSNEWLSIYFNPEITLKKSS